MCTSVIIDANLFTIMPDRSKDGNDPQDQLEDHPHRHLHNWIKRGDGKMVYAETGTYWREAIRDYQAQKLFRTFREAGLAELVKEIDLARARNSLQHRSFYRKIRDKSNDQHILELAWASRALVLCTKDSNLQDSFKKLPRVDHELRSIYPSESNDSNKRKFLNRRRCDKER